MAPRRPLIPSLPLPRRALPWILFVLGIASIVYGAWTRDFAGLTIGTVAVGGAVLSWMAEWLLNASRAPDDQPPE